MRAVTRRLFSEELALADSLELARRYDLPAALNAIREKLIVHASVPDRHRRFSLAVTEAAIGAGGSLGTKKIIEARATSVVILEEERVKSAENRMRQIALRYSQNQARQWSSSYARFQTEMTNLYKVTSRRIDELHLPPTRQLEALAALEQIISRAFERSGELK
jgi:hypothetical protein